jgi:hypothetical protein
MIGKQHTEAFVVQFRAGTDVAAGQCDGRLEHVASGRMTHFRSLEELLALMKQWLTELRSAPGESEMPIALVEKQGKRGKP